MSTTAERVHQIHPADNVATALQRLEPGETLCVENSRLVTRAAIPFGHKVALVAIPVGSRVIKYGEVIGVATCDIAPGEHVHSHNLVTQRGIRLRVGA